MPWNFLWWSTIPPPAIAAVEEPYSQRGSGEGEARTRRGGGISSAGTDEGELE
eukprot:c20459_g2_i1 orf=108-266(+)